uniref:Basic leucine zipper 2 n=1 Tax=Noccaea caerulescens TaxID=107243 RepID=A0A1J3F7K2_NOCCA
MSRPGQLPPRCPIPKKLSLNPVGDTYYSSSSPIESYISQYKSSTQESKLEDQPAWLDELLCEKTDGLLTGGGPGPLRRSASDSVVLLGDISANFSGFNQSEDEESLTSEACGELESACVYGPNSPRARNSSSFSNNPIASAFSDYGSHNSDDTVKGINCMPLAEDGCSSMGVPNAKRNPGQRSRVRKLQYIAELERRVSMLQTVEADLSVRVASLLQTRATLSLENSQLKQQMAILKQDKLIREGEYQLLKKEAQRLKSGLGNFGSNNRLVRSYSAGSDVGPRRASSHLDWKLLDLTKLNLN